MHNHDRIVETDRKILKKSWDSNRNNMQENYKDFNEYVKVSEQMYVILEYLKFKMTEQELKKGMKRGGGNA